MNATRSNNDDDRLGKLLHEWQPEMSLPPGFKDDVWRRIARLDDESKGSVWADFWRTIDAAFRQPALAISYVAILVVIGLGVGRFQARETAAKLDRSLEARYLAAVDPYLKTR
jgi:hypothetical protein